MKTVARATGLFKHEQYKHLKFSADNFNFRNSCSEGIKFPCGAMVNLERYMAHE